MNYLIYLAVRGSIAIAAMTPLTILQIKSRFLAWLLRVVIRYRVALVETHLRESFPEKSPTELKKIKKAFYLNLSDILVETIKGYSMSSDQLNHRFTLKNEALLEPYYKAGQSLIGIGAHLANWEWGSESLSKKLKHHVVLVVGDVNNKYLDEYITKKRSSENVSLIKRKEIIGAIKKYKDRPSLFILVADQCPSNVKHALWTPFLNRVTPFIHSPEKLSKKYDLPCFYMPLERVARSSYQLSFVAIQHEHITQEFVKLLEKTIKRIPEQWLWTHRRWKRQHLNPRR